jgi:hypothetical protein
VTEGHQKLIDELVGDLRPVRRPGRVGVQAVLWLCAATIYSVVIVLGTGPLRPGALEALAAYPPFAAETLLAAAAIAALALAALRSAIPGEPWVTRWLLWVVPLTAWVALYVAELRYPPAYVSDLGGRYECLWQVVLFSLPTFAFMLWSARRLLPLRPRLTGLLAGAAAAAIPGALMQFGCMYVPSHILTHHLAPIAITGALGALIGPWALRLRGDVWRRGRAGSVH